MRPVKVRGAVWVPAASATLSVVVLSAGFWLMCSRDVFGEATLTRITSSGFVLLVGVLMVLMAVGTLRTRVVVFPDRLEATSWFGRVQTIRPHELVRISPSGSRNVVVSGITGRGRGFVSDRFHRRYDALASWLRQRAPEPWAAYQDDLGKLPHWKKPRRVYDFSMLLIVVGTFIITLVMFPGLQVLSAYDDAHQQQVVCTITAAEPVSKSTTVTTGITSYPAVDIDTADCGQLTFSRGVDGDNRDEVARTYEHAPGQYLFTVGSGSFWIAKNTAWELLAPTVYAIREVPIHADAG